MKRYFQALALCLIPVLPAAADTSPVVVELYTSQGCSSCPPADEMMQVLAEREDVIALSLHVDYWDYIGWKDEFADPRNAERQRGYAQTAGRSSIYTPEMIVNGVSEIVGAKPMKLAMAIERHKNDPQHVSLNVKRQGDNLVIDAQSLTDDPGKMYVHLLRYDPSRQAQITRGENAGRTISYVNVTQDWTVVGAWEDAAEFNLTVKAPGDLPVVVLVQSGKYGAILAARELK